MGQGVAQDDEQAVSYVRRAMLRGDRYGTTDLGWMYKNGRGVERDFEEAVRLYQLAADDGDVVAMYNLGQSLMAGVVRGKPGKRREE